MQRYDLACAKCVPILREAFINRRNFSETKRWIMKEKDGRMIEMYVTFAESKIVIL